MNWWVLKQLRARVIEDLRDYIPKDYFEKFTNKFKIDPSIENSDHYSKELNWGYSASTIGKELFFNPPLNMTARQISASDVLMNLGFLSAAKAAQGVTTKLSEFASKKNLPDGNSGAVSKQFEENQIPVFIENVKGALEQYLLHLNENESKPFLSILNEEISCEINDDNKNINKLIGRMNIFLKTNDPSGVLHCSASIFETLAKEISNNNNIRDKSLGSFFELYRKTSLLPWNILDYILSIYNRRNTEPLAGHGSLDEPSISHKEAIVLSELTLSIVRIERNLQKNFKNNN